MKIEKNFRDYQPPMTYEFIAENEEEATALQELYDDLNKYKGNLSWLVGERHSGMTKMNKLVLVLTQGEKTDYPTYPKGFSPRMSKRELSGEQ